MKIYFKTETDQDERPIFIELYNDGSGTFLSIGTLEDFANQDENTVLLSHETLSALGSVLSPGTRHRQ